MRSRRDTLTIDSFSKLVTVASDGNDTAVLSDTASDDSIVFGENQMSMNNNILLNGFDSVTVKCENGGSDSVSVTGTTGADAFSLNANSLSAKLSSGAALNITGAPSNVTINGMGGSDALTASDSTGGDAFTLEPGALKAVLGTGAVWNVSNVSNIRVNQINGGADSLTVNDSAGDDKVVVSPKFVTMTSSNATVTAAGFEEIFSEKPQRKRCGGDVRFDFERHSNGHSRRRRFPDGRELPQSSERLPQGEPLCGERRRRHGKHSGCV